MTFDSTSDDFTSTEKGTLTTHSSDAVSPGGRVVGRGVAARPGPHGRAGGRRRRGVAAARRLPGRPEVEPLRRGAGDQGHPGPGEAGRREVARRPRAHPRGRLALAARVRRLVRPDRRRDRHRRAARRRPDLPRAVARLGVGRAVRPALDVRGAGPGARRAGGQGHRRHAARAPEGVARVVGCRRPQRLGRLGRLPVRGRRRLRLPGGLRGDLVPRPPASTTPSSSAVLGAAIRGERAYDPAGTKDANGGRTDWMRWLDLLETRGGRHGRRRGLPALGAHRTSSGPPWPRAPRRARPTRRSTRPTGRGCRPRACATR